jgi:hypothetical protein
MFAYAWPQSIPKSLNGWDLKVIPMVIWAARAFTAAKAASSARWSRLVHYGRFKQPDLIGINSYWQDLFNGLVILAGVTVSAVQAKRVVYRGVTYEKRNSIRNNYTFLMLGLLLIVLTTFSITKFSTLWKLSTWQSMSMQFLSMA